MQKSRGPCVPECGILEGVAHPLRNEIRLGGFVPVNFVLEMCVRVVISEYASLVRKSYSVVSGQTVPSYWQKNHLKTKRARFPSNRVHRANYYA